MANAAFIYILGIYCRHNNKIGTCCSFVDFHFSVPVIVTNYTRT